VHIPNPSALVRPLRRTYQYFRTGVDLDGDAWLCTESHVPLTFVGPEGAERDRVSQHIDVSLRFWNRRSDPVAVIEIAKVDLPARSM
jgi:hypothetical protein